MGEDAALLPKPVLGGPADSAAHPETRARWARTWGQDAIEILALRL